MFLIIDAPILMRSTKSEIFFLYQTLNNLFLNCRQKNPSDGLPLRLLKFIVKHGTS